MANIDKAVVADFGREWRAFDQAAMPDEEAKRRFVEYFSLMQFDPESEGFDLGCGSGRWARLVAPKVGFLHCLDPSDAIDVARQTVTAPNVDFRQASADDIGLSNQDFGYCLGVLHHIPDTQAALNNAVAALRPGGQFLVYIYYALENRPAWFRAIWRVSDVIRRGVSVLPYPLKRMFAAFVAAIIYWPLARAGGPSCPLNYYKDKSFYTMRTDALDRFGTRLEKRFTKDETRAMMEAAGLTQIRFSDRAPYWVALGIKRSARSSSSSRP